jgi:2-polyprenyl-3-methyl-5-hydroxy-6-metoxy-1,4-benzoquinol methylase
VLHLIPTKLSRVLDIGAGTGRDAAGFAALGHHVVAVEPTAELRTRATALHPSSQIEWVDDSLPNLASIIARGDMFDAVMLTAVWMHLDHRQRKIAMPKVASLISPGGVLIMSLRYGPVPKGRRMFAVSANETIVLANAEDLKLVLRLESQDGLLGRPGISWARLAFIG